MNMDRSQKNLEKKKDDRTIEYLELKYDTNIQRGLTLAKVRQKPVSYTHLDVYKRQKLFSSRADGRSLP